MNKKLLFLIISLLPLFSSYAQSKIEILTSKDYKWDEVLNIPPGAANTVGNQILHFKATNKPYEADEEAKKFVHKYLLKAKKLSSDAEVLKAGLDTVSIDGFYIEAGVCTGKTINFIGALNPLKVIYGFDSFEGLPAD